MTHDLYLCMLAAVLGQFTHLLLILQEMSSAAGRRVGFTYYTRKRPYKFTLAIISSIVGVAVLHQYNELTVLTAFGVAAYSSDVLDRVGRITAAKLPAP
jgi:hypothetical protein